MASKQKNPIKILNPNWSNLQEKLKSNGSKNRFPKNSTESNTETPKSILGKRKERSNEDSQASKPSPLIPISSDSSLTDAVAMDCEMVGVSSLGNKSALGRVTLVNAWGNVVYDEYVRPVEYVVDFRTEISGIRPRDLKKEYTITLFILYLGAGNLRFFFPLVSITAIKSIKGIYWLVESLVRRLKLSFVCPNRIEKESYYWLDSLPYWFGIARMMADFDKCLKHAAKNFNIVQKQVAEMINGRTLVGHALHNDLKALLLTHPKKDIRDTSLYAPYLKEGRSSSLKNLAAQFLGAEIQNGEHCPVEDARAAMLLYQKNRKQWERSVKDVMRLQAKQKKRKPRKKLKDTARGL